MPRDHECEIELPLEPPAVFGLLVTPSHIRGWWGAATAIVLPGPGGIWSAAWGEAEDAPDYVTAAVMSVWEPGERLVLTDYQYHAREGGLPFEADFETAFRMQARENGTLLTIRQSGFPDDPAADEFYAGCERGWADTTAALLVYARTLA